MKAITLLLFLMPFCMYAQTGKIKRTINAPAISGAASTLGLTPSLNPNEIIVKVDDHTGNALNLIILNLQTNQQTPRTITLQPYSFFTITTTDITFSAVNIPFKIRSKVDSTEANVETNIANIGLFIGKKREAKRYYYSGRETVHSICGGLFISPTAINLNEVNTEGRVTGEISQFGLSTGIGFSYTYNKVSFMVIPAGFDIGLSSKTDTWIYNKKYWFGFGFGVDLGLFN